MKKIVIFFFCFSLVACHPSSRNYQAPLSQRIVSFSQLKYSNNTYLITYKSNGLINRDTAFNIALRKCAELTKEKGYNYFKIIKSSIFVVQDVYQSPLHEEVNSTYSSSVYPPYNYIGEQNQEVDIDGNFQLAERFTISIQIQLYKNFVSKALNADVILQRSIFPSAVLVGPYLEML